MTYAESYIQINNTWHLLLIVKTSEPTAFGSLISFESGDYTCIYSVNTPMRTFVEDVSTTTGSCRPQRKLYPHLK